MRNRIEDAIGMLGFEATSKVDGFKGVVTSVSFDLSGCLQLYVSPRADKDMKLPGGIWIDINRLDITSKEPVMDQPEFLDDPPGPTDKSAPTYG